MIDYEILFQCVKQTLTMFLPILFIYVVYKLIILFIIKYAIKRFILEVDNLFYLYLIDNPLDSTMYYLWDKKQAMKDKSILNVTPSIYLTDYISSFKNEECFLFHIVSKKKIIKDMKKEGIDIKRIQEIVGEIDG